ncbi:MAG: AAA family ATPase [Armatimonadetes bacterium]|nr:AAA family ATPase [Armatimonadota bacterium]
MPRPTELSADQCRWHCEHSSFTFRSTAELNEEVEPIGQERAMRALDFGAGIASEGYNVFALGAPGTGRTSLVLQAIQRKAEDMPTPNDWCYVHNFDDPRSPRALSLPAGMAATFRDDVAELIEDADREITRAFESDEYSERREEVLREFREARNAELQAFEREVQEAGLAIGRAPAGLIVAPAKDGEVMSPQDYQQLPAEEREAIDARRQELQEKLDEIMRRGQREEKRARKQVAELDREVALAAIGALVEDLQHKYAELPEVVTYLEQVRDDIVDNVDAFRTDHSEEPMADAVPDQRLPGGPRQPLDRYRVNVLISHQDGNGAPVVYETNPTIENLTGEIEHIAVMGALLTDFTMIEPGALHRANGGFLVMEARTILTKPFAWEALKRALRGDQIRPESVREHVGLISTVTIDPEPIPLNVKVVLIGTPQIFYLLHELDEDFRKLFKVKADFSTVLDCTDEALRQYAAFIGSICHRENLPHFDPGAVAAIAEEGARLAGDREKLTTRFLEVADLVREAAYWCRRDGGELVSAAHVRHSIEESLYRSNRIEERLLELIEQGTLLVDVTGEKIGQINGIAVIPLGDYAVGKPTRITARSFLGKPGVINIDREAELTGPIHDKGTMILAGYIGQQFATDRPLSATITLAFEQAYEGMEGDSAAVAELCALISSLGEIPLRQDLAVSGSVNQHGRVQAVGGINTKIEGFFKTCRLLGLTGTQGVIIPAANVRNLMLRPEVLEAIEAGEFHIYPVETIEEALELLTGMPAGERDDSGKFPEGTVFQAVDARLEEMAAAAREHDGEGDDAKSDK